MSEKFYEVNVKVKVFARNEKAAIYKISSQLNRCEEDPDFCCDSFVDGFNFGKIRLMRWLNRKRKWV